MQCGSFTWKLEAAYQESNWALGCANQAEAFLIFLSKNFSAFLSYIFVTCFVLVTISVRINLALSCPGKENVKVGLSPSKIIYVICFIECSLKMMKNAFHFILKALFALIIFKLLLWIFGHVKKMAWLER